MSVGHEQHTVQKKRCKTECIGGNKGKIGLENFTTEEAKQKIKSLRATYQQESHKIDKSLRFGRCIQTINEVVYINNRSDEKWCFEESVIYDQ